MGGTMSRRQLGKNGPKVSAIGYGAMGLSAFYGPPAPDEERFKVLNRVIELGSTYIDSADMYGDNEELLAKYFKKYPQQRQKVFLATKFANVISPDGKFSVRGDAEYVRQSLEKSLNRLQLPYVDLYYVHRIDKKVPIEETMEVLKEFVEKGKIRYIGLSKCSRDTIRRALAVHPISAIQIEYSPFSLDIEKPENAVLKSCRELGIAIVCYSPLGRGMLTRQFSKENFSKNLQLVDTLKQFADKKNCTIGQFTLAWILAQGDDFIVIPGTTKIKNLEENVGAAKVKLTKDEIGESRKACENADAAGARYPEAFVSNLFGDSAPRRK